MLFLQTLQLSNCRADRNRLNVRDFTKYLEEHRSIVFEVCLTARELSGRGPRNARVTVRLIEVLAWLTFSILSSYS